MGCQALKYIEYDLNIAVGGLKMVKSQGKLVVL
jgi:hypothetical protein